MITLPFNIVIIKFFYFWIGWRRKRICSWLLIIGKECFLYKVVTGFNSLSAVPEWGLLVNWHFLLEDEGWKYHWKRMGVCRKLYKTLYNIQDVYILSVMLENKRQKIEDETGFGPKCFTCASILSGTNERIKSKVILTFPKDVERLLSGELFFCSHKV